MGASLGKVKYPPPGKRGLETWLLDHYVSHKIIVNALAKKQIIVPMRQIYPLDITDQQQLAIWLEQHQQMHDDMNGPLEITGNDLSSVDFGNQEQLDGFMFLNYQEHRAAYLNIPLTGV